MKCVVISTAGYYANTDLKPAWVPDMAGAKVFRSVGMAKGVVKILRRNRIEAKVIKIGPGAANAK